MFFSPRQFLAVSAAALTARALSSGCTTAVAGLALGDLGSCLQLTSLLPLLTSSGDLTTSLNTYLTSLCSSSTTVCSNSTLTSAESTITSGCSTDISGGGSTAYEVDALLVVVDDYTEVHTAACSKNSTTNAFCITQILSTISNTTGSSITVDFVTGLLAGTGNYTTVLQTALASGQLCTGCMQEVYYQAVQANSTISSSPIGQAVSSACGASFASTSPSGVATTSAASSSSASSTASSTKSASSPQTFMLPIGAVAGGVVMLGAILAGGALVL